MKYLTAGKMRLLQMVDSDQLLHAYGIYLSHYLADDVFPGATLWDHAFIGGFNLSIAMLVAPLVTTVVRWRT
ncbi:hypothetical protein M3J09_007901 [Ascochyta lentis]